MCLLKTHGKIISDTPNILWVCNHCLETPDSAHQKVSSNGDFDATKVLMQKEIECLEREKVLADKLINELSYSNSLQKKIIDNLEENKNYKATSQFPKQQNAIEDEAISHHVTNQTQASFARAVKSTRNILPRQISPMANPNINSNRISAAAAPGASTASTNSNISKQGQSSTTSLSSQQNQTNNARGKLDPNAIKNAIHEAQSASILREIQHLESSGQMDVVRQDLSRKRNRRYVVGKNDDNKTVTAVPKYTSLHVTRLAPNTKTEDLKMILINKFPEVTCEEHPSKQPSLYTSMKVTIKQENFREAWKREIWPNGALVSRFLAKKRVPETVQRDPPPETALT